MGFSLVLYANAPLQGAVLGMQNALRELQHCGGLNEADGLLATFTERQRLVDKIHFDAMERKYGSQGDPS